MADVYRNAQQAFVDLYERISLCGMERDGTRALFNIGFMMYRPTEREILTDWRGWNKKYAEREWEWYMSENRDVRELAKYAPIWDRMHSGDGIVNSNYGWQWNRNGQLDYVIRELTERPESRRAVLTIYDAKEHAGYAHDTPCTTSIQFYRAPTKRLNMAVSMRSNDLWYGFCNDQYCFSKLQEMVAKQMKLDVGHYYHHATDMHLYEDQLGKNPEIM